MKYLRHAQMVSPSVLGLTSPCFVAPPDACSSTECCWGYPPETSALTLLGDLETMLRDYLYQALSDLPRSEQHNAFGSEPFLGDPHQLLERNFARIAEELDRTRRLSQACTTSKVVNQGAATRSPVVR